MKLKIFGLLVPVKRQSLKEDGTAAHYDLVKQEIVVDREAVGDEFIQCILHELIHCVMFRTGFAQTQMHADIHEMLSENISVAIVENFNLKLKTKK